MDIYFTYMRLGTWSSTTTQNETVLIRDMDDAMNNDELCFVEETVVVVCPSSLTWNNCTWWGKGERECDGPVVIAWHDLLNLHRRRQFIYSMCSSPIPFWHCPQQTPYPHIMLHTLTCSLYANFRINIMFWIALRCDIGTLRDNGRVSGCLLRLDNSQQPRRHRQTVELCSALLLSDSRIYGVFRSSSTARLGWIIHFFVGANIMLIYVCIEYKERLKGASISFFLPWGVYAQIRFNSKMCNWIYYLRWWRLIDDGRRVTWSVLELFDSRKSNL